MNLIKDAFVILYFPASTDGNIDPRESKMIVDFVSLQPGNLNFNAGQTIMAGEILKRFSAFSHF